jgi:hypothetical protein
VTFVATIWPYRPMASFGLKSMNIESVSIKWQPRQALSKSIARALRAARECLATLGATVLLSMSAHAFAGLLASASISTSSTSAPYNYTIKLNDTGTTNIGTFWFAWTDVPANYDFLPSSPTVTTMPSGWIAPITHSGFPGDGYAIEFYNLSGSAITPGHSATFKFTSPDSPATLAANAFIPFDKVTTSIVYIGFPQTDPGFGFNVAPVPEPSTIVLGAVGACVGLLIWRRRRRKAIVSS